MRPVEYYKLACIKDIDSFGERLSITLEKAYTAFCYSDEWVWSNNGIYYTVVGDNGKVIEYHEPIFKKLIGPFSEEKDLEREYREMSINKTIDQL